MSREIPRLRGILASKSKRIGQLEHMIGETKDVANTEYEKLHAELEQVKHSFTAKLKEKERESEDGNLNGLLQACSSVEWVVWWVWLQALVLLWGVAWKLHCFKLSMVGWGGCTVCNHDLGWCDGVCGCDFKLSLPLGWVWLQALKSIQ
jgi:hypothetical protein